MRPRCHAPAREATIVGRFDVERRVADQHRRGGGCSELFQGVRGELRLRLDPRRVFRAENSAEVGRDAEMLANEAGVIAALVGEHGEFYAGMLRAQQLQRAGHQGDIVEKNRVRVGDVLLDRRRDQLLGQKVAHRVFEPAADRVAHLVDRRHGAPEKRQRVHVGPVNRRERIHNRAIQIEQNSSKARHEAGEI
jgi:hypothetical protein